MSIVGLGWGQATRTTRLTDAAAAAVRGEVDGNPGEAAGRPGRPNSVPSTRLEAVRERDAVPRIGEERRETAGELSPPMLFDPATTGRVIGLWILTPSLVAALSYLLFPFVLGP